MQTVKPEWKGVYILTGHESVFPESDNTNEPQSLNRISKDEKKKPVSYNDHKDELTSFRKKILRYYLPPPLVPSELPDEFRMKQRVSYERYREMDFASTFSSGCMATCAANPPTIT